MGLGTWVHGSSGSPITISVTNPADDGTRAFEGRLSFEVRGAEPTSIVVTYGGVTATLVTGSPSQNPTGVVVRTYSYYILDADLPAVGAQNAVATFSGGSDYSAGFSATVHTGVTQSAPAYHENAVDPVETTLTVPAAGTWSYANGDFATFAANNSDSTSSFTWSASWTERQDAADFVGEHRYALADRAYSGSGTDSVTATISAGSRIAGAVLLWTAAAAGPTITTQPTAQTAVINNSSTPTATFTCDFAEALDSATYELEDSVGSGTSSTITTGGIHSITTNLATGLCTWAITPTTKTGLTGRRIRITGTTASGSTVSNAVALTVYTGFQFTSSTTATTNGSGVATVTWTDDRPGSALGNGGFVKHIATSGSAVSRSSARPT